MSHTTTRPGMIYGIAAFASWGLLPLYWIQLSTLPSLEIIAHRVVWSLLFLALIVWKKGALQEVLAALRSPQRAILLALSGFLIALNWLVYVWGVHHGHLVEASLGYFLSPIITIALGAFILKEPLSGRRKVAVAIASLGVLFKALDAGVFPWVGVTLAVSISLYGFIRKRIPISSLAGLTVETLLLSPLALGHLYFLSIHDRSHLFSMSTSTTILLVLTGVCTSLPLLWFVRASQLLPLSVLGIVQYLSPSLQLLVSLFVFMNPLTFNGLLSFCCIWSAIALYLTGKREIRL
jgi:chloramphenicol-sensitive protein RarD